MYFCASFMSVGSITPPLNLKTRCKVDSENTVNTGIRIFWWIRFTKQVKFNLIEKIIGHQLLAIAIKNIFKNLAIKSNSESVRPFALTRTIASQNEKPTFRSQWFINNNMVLLTSLQSEQKFLFSFLTLVDVKELLGSINHSNKSSNSLAELLKSTSSLLKYYEKTRVV